MTEGNTDSGNRLRHIAPAERDEAATEGITSINEERYLSLMREAAEIRGRIEASDVGKRDRVDAFLFWEARLLDERRYRHWLRLLTEDCAYWVPGSPDVLDPRVESGVNFDDYRRLTDRITLIETGSLLAQIPPSRMCRIVSNIEVWPDNHDRLEVRSNIVIWEYRRGTTTRFIGSQEHQLVAREDHWAIRRKVIRLINCDEPQGNVTFIL